MIRFIAADYTGFPETAKPCVRLVGRRRLISWGRCEYPNLCLIFTKWEVYSGWF